MTVTEGTRSEQRPSNHPDAEAVPGWWFACDYPERRFAQSQTRIRWTCYPCWIYAVSAVKQGCGDSERHHTLTRGPELLRDGVVRGGVEYGWFDRSGIDPESL